MGSLFGEQGNEAPVARAKINARKEEAAKTRSHILVKWRYRWPDEVRDEVLARLLKLNAERAEEERIAGRAAATAAPAKTKKSRGKKSDAAPAQGEIIPSPQKDLFT